MNGCLITKEWDRKRREREGDGKGKERGGGDREGNLPGTSLRDKNSSYGARTVGEPKKGKDNPRLLNDGDCSSVPGST